MGDGVQKFPSGSQALSKGSPKRPAQTGLKAPSRQDKDMLYCPKLSQQDHGDDISSSSEDDCYPEDMDQDKHNDSTDDGDSDRSDGESEGDEFVHCDDSKRKNNEEKRLDRVHNMQLYVKNQGRRT
ncbi:WW domain-binding protein 11 [Tupaia chinensis]|uniref:WW domain-binding protein 11 n=1 Tax=Tupaia chinensis TaxID=246437 RepID=L9KXU3_TUPCH|nr:WW domain-binding protein 11 [Tupaia chinensis]